MASSTSVALQVQIGLAGNVSLVLVKSGMAVFVLTGVHSAIVGGALRARSLIDQAVAKVCEISTHAGMLNVSVVCGMLRLAINSR